MMETWKINFSIITFQLVILTFNNCYVIFEALCWTISRLLSINVFPYYCSLSLAAFNLVIQISVGYYPEINHINPRLVIS